MAGILHRQRRTFSKALQCIKNKFSFFEKFHSINHVFYKFFICSDDFSLWQKVLIEWFE